MLKGLTWFFGATSFVGVNILFPNTGTLAASTLALLALTFWAFRPKGRHWGE